MATINQNGRVTAHRGGTVNISVKPANWSLGWQTITLTVVVPFTQRTGWVTASSLNVRSGAGTNHSTVGNALPLHTQVTVIGESGSWWQISSPRNGWVHKDWITFTRPGASVAGGTGGDTPRSIPNPPVVGTTLHTLIVQDDVNSYFANLRQIVANASNLTPAMKTLITVQLNILQQAITIAISASGTSLGAASAASITQILNNARQLVVNATSQPQQRRAVVTSHPRSGDRIDTTGEAATVRNILNNNRFTVDSRSNWTFTQLRDVMPGAYIISLHGHGNQTSIYLGGGRVFRNTDIPSIRGTRLVVAAACHSAQAPNSMAERFVNAGATTSIGWLGQPGNRSLASFTGIFYRELANGQTVQRAANTAARDFIPPSLATQQIIADTENFRIFGERENRPFS